VLSLGGVAARGGGGKLPAPLQRFLDEYPEVETVTLSLDNDEAGRCTGSGEEGGLQDATFRQHHLQLH
jgi:hypothetical protein